MEIVLGVMVLGILLGILLRKKPKIIKSAEYLSSWAIYLLLFLLGVSVGLNDDIIHNFEKIGFQAAIIAIASIAGSVFFGWLIYKSLFQSKS